MAKVNYKKFFKGQEIYKATEGNLLYVFSPYAVVVSDIHNDVFVKEIAGLTFADSSGKEEVMKKFLDSLKDYLPFPYSVSPFIHHDKKGDICFLIPDDKGRKTILVNNRYIEPFEKQMASIQVYNDTMNTVMIADYDNATFNYILPIKPNRAEYFKAEAAKIANSLYL